MLPEELGYSKELEEYRAENRLLDFDVGRIMAEHKERYYVKTIHREYEAEIIGNMRFTAKSRSDFPAVGDWVAISEYDEDKVLIHAILPRKTIIERQAAGKASEKQILATNVDMAFILQAVDRDFNVNRLERYLTICHNSNIQSVIILNKIDLIASEKLAEMTKMIKNRISGVLILAISNETREGFDQVYKLLKTGKTYCLLGSSGVGKSTFINTLSGSELMKTNTISNSAQRGRHVTSHRELIVLEGGGIIVDNPGMREVGVTDMSDGLENTFNAIYEYASSCKFFDCTHIHENDCAVLRAVEEGLISRASYENFLKLEREKEHYESTVAERRKKDRDFGKVVKEFKKKKSQLKPGKYTSE